METTGSRIKKALEIRNMKQIDLAQNTGMARGAISRGSVNVTVKQ